tara:strand:+ start:105 stop:1277 length:1173 start_codon:yes stop_codon:yes gene_type:complete
MSQINASNFKKEYGNEGPDLVGITTLTSPYFMVPPSGTTAQRPQNPSPGTLRFNTDSGSLEFFRGDTIGWETIVKTSPNLGGGTGSNKGTGARAFFAGGNDPGACNFIDYVTISTLGNAEDFGILVTVKQRMAPAASNTRGILAGGYNVPASSPGFINDIDYFTIATKGDAVDFGNLTRTNNRIGGVSSQTRGCFGGGNPESDVIDYITIASTGDAKDFGNLTNSRQSSKGLGSSTRGLFIGGLDGSDPYTSLNLVDYITISSTGNATDFGDLNRVSQTGGSCSNSTRGLYTGGYGSPSSPSLVNSIAYCTIATLGNFIDFGDATNAIRDCTSAASPTRALTGVGGYDGSINQNTIDYVEIATTGNANNFGDLSVQRNALEGQSNAHGGL